MYRTLSHLQSALRTSLERTDLRRIYQETLAACWPDLSDAQRAEKIVDFATENGWSVTFRDDESFGVVAEFSNASSPKKD